MMQSCPKHTVCFGKKRQKLFSELNSGKLNSFSMSRQKFMTMMILSELTILTKKVKLDNCT